MATYLSYMSCAMRAGLELAPAISCTVVNAMRYKAIVAEPTCAKASHRHEGT